MRFKLDENLGLRGSVLLTDAGHDVSTVPAQQLEGASDNVLIEVCRAEARCLVTLDLDFANPILYPPQRYAGIVVIRIPVNANFSDLVSALKLMTKAIVKTRTLDGKLWVIGGDRIREYAPET